MKSPLSLLAAPLLALGLCAWLASPLRPGASLAEPEVPTSGSDPLLPESLRSALAKIEGLPADAAIEGRGVTVSTLAGSGRRGFADGASTLASFQAPAALKGDGGPGLLVQDGVAIRGVGADGAVSTPGWMPGLGCVLGRVQPRPSGGLLLAERACDPDAEAVADRPLHCGGLLAWEGGEIEVLFDHPERTWGLQPRLVAVGEAGAIYVYYHRAFGEPPYQKLVRLPPEGGFEVVASLEDEGPWLPAGLAVDARGLAHLAYPDHVIRVAPGGEVQLAAGSRDGSGPFGHLADLALAPDNALYMADAAANRLWKLAPDGRLTTVVGGTGPGYIDGPGEKARFRGLTGVAVGPDGDIYVSDHGNRRLRRLRLSPPA